MPEGTQLEQVKELREVTFSRDRPWGADICLPILRGLAVKE
jgi:hypothetical protein